jgi:hypothetical protein
LAGTQFRIWATQRLREFIVKGFTLDDERLKQGRGVPIRGAIVTPDGIRGTDRAHYGWKSAGVPGHDDLPPFLLSYTVDDALFEVPLEGNAHESKIALASGITNYSALKLQKKGKQFRE